MHVYDVGQIKFHSSHLSMMVVYDQTMSRLVHEKGSPNKKYHR